MQNNGLTIKYKQLDSYSLLIVSKYFKTLTDYINLICVNSKFKETTKKLRYNPISIKSLKLFSNIQTQYLYSDKDKRIKRKQIVKYELWYEVDYKEFLKNKKKNTKYRFIKYTHENRIKYGDVIPNYINILGDNCFGRKDIYSNNQSKIREITIPSSIQSIGIRCFNACSSLTYVSLLSTITSLSNGCFGNCVSLTSINLPSKLQILGENCFIYCTSLTSIILPTTLSIMGSYCFYYCSSLISINIPYSLTSLSEGCFMSCHSLPTINLPSSIISFGNGCFYECDQLNYYLNVPDNCFQQLPYLI